jgi:TonB family protein
MATDLISYLVEASICQGICYLFYWLFLRKEASFGFNRLYMLAVLTLSVAVPFFEIPAENSLVYLPQQMNMVYKAEMPVASTDYAIQETVAPEKTTDVQQVFFYGYAAICLLLGLRLLYQAGFLYHLWLSGKRQLYKQYTLICTDGKLPTSSFFGWLFWDNTRLLQLEDAALIIQHERVHIEQSHSRDMVFLQLLKIIFWFNPAIYLFEKALQEVHEYLADKDTVRSDNRQKYMHLLVAQAFIRQPVSLLNSFNGPLIHRRIAMIRANRQPVPVNFWKIGISVGLVAGAVYLQACQPKEIAQPLPGRVLDTDNTYWLSAHGTVAKSNRFKEGEYLYGHYPKPDVDEYAYPVGGFNPFRNYIQNNLREPDKIKPAGLIKKVFVQFTVDKQGYIRNPRVLPGMGLGPGFDEEAIRVIANGPRWVPAKKNGKPVEASMMEVVVFGRNESRFVGAAHQMTRNAAKSGGPIPVEDVTNLVHKIILTYPEEARKQLIEGMVVVGFTVQADGNVSNFEVVQPIHPALDREALRVARQANVSWKPAMKNGKAQVSRVLISFGFYLAD